MPQVSISQIQDLQSEPSKIRNFCIVAHVDHGKTTLSDSLIASNAIISGRLAGQMRYLDSRPDEQVRGITMKSSIISLSHAIEREIKDKESNEQQDDATKTTMKEKYLLNLIDSPGHVDFASEVSTAVRLCDGALLVVDAVEGVCPQTYTVLRQVFLEGLKPVLVINKVDRLITELELDPSSAFEHLSRVIEVVNAVVAGLLSARCIEEAELKGDYVNFDHSSYFSPAYGNVCFVSAIDGWGFGTEQFASLWINKLNVPKNVLKKVLWGDYWFDPRSKKVMKNALNKGKKNMAIQYMIEPIWELYEAIMVRNTEKIDKFTKRLKLKISPRDARGTRKGHLQAVMRQWLPLYKIVLDMVVKKLPSPDKIEYDRAQALIYGHKDKTLLSSEAVSQLDQFVDDIKKCSKTNSNLIAFASKVESFDQSAFPVKREVVSAEEMYKRRDEVKKRLKEKYENSLGGNDNSMLLGDEIDTHGALSCGTLHENLVSYTNTTDPATSMCIDLALDNGKMQDCSKNSVLVAFARIYSGELRVGQEVKVLGPKYNPYLDPDSTNDSETQYSKQTITISGLYLVMGSELNAVSKVGAGNIIGITGLENAMLKIATITSTQPQCPSLSPIYIETQPVVTVALQPSKIDDYAKLSRGLKLLQQADSLAEISHADSGELLLHAAGEVHLERCIKDLTEEFAKCKINRSEPIVPFRETIIHQPKKDMRGQLILNQKNNKDSVNELGSSSGGGADKKNSKYGLVDGLLASKKVYMSMGTIPLPKGVSDHIDRHKDLLSDNFKAIRHGTKENIGSSSSSFSLLSDPENARKAEGITNFYSTLAQLFADDELYTWPKDIVDSIIAFGPKDIGPNILLHNTLLDKEHQGGGSQSNNTSSTSLELQDENNRGIDKTLLPSVRSGFEIATNSGPLCAEPVRGVCFVLCDLKERNTNTTTNNNNVSANTSKAVILGQLINASKDMCHKSLMQSHARLMIAMYRCEIQAMADVLGRVYAVVSKRQGQIYQEMLKEGTDMFIVKCYLPIRNSFGFVDEVRKKASGSANPQLVYDHWEVLKTDPFWIPSTEEEITHYGEKSDTDNMARKYMNEVRKRKGLNVDEQIVEYGEKQRTLGRNK